MKELLKKIHDSIEMDMTPDEIEAEIDAAVAEVRRERWNQPQTPLNQD